MLLYHLCVHTLRPCQAECIYCRWRYFTVSPHAVQTQDCLLRVFTSIKRMQVCRSNLLLHTHTHKHTSVIYVAPVRVVLPHTPRWILVKKKKNNFWLFLTLRALECQHTLRNLELFFIEHAWCFVPMCECVHAWSWRTYLYRYLQTTCVHLCTYAEDLLKPVFSLEKHC